MKVAVLAFVLTLMLLSQNSVESLQFPDLLASETYDEDAYERMLPDDEILLSRRREDPETDEDSWSYQDWNSDTSSVIMTSNMDDVKNVVWVNGIDISKLPPSYHKTTTVTKKIGNRNVTVNITIDKTTDPVTGQTSISVIQTSKSGGIGLTQCASSKPCGKDKYCRRLLYGNFCSKCSNISEKCESNDQCCDTGTTGALCVKGTCQTGFKRGQAGTICQTKSDCNTGLCCTRQFMKKNGECKPLAKSGEKCAASGGQMNIILRPGLCPCADGLVCSSGSWLESFFGGSMNTLLGGNTCRTRGKARKSSSSSWPFEFFDEKEKYDFDDIFAP